jgi:hypothetical protein
LLADCSWRSAAGEPVQVHAWLAHQIVATCASRQRGNEGGNSYISSGQRTVERAARAQEIDEERLSLSDAAEFILEECRMVLPGMQALFGFQLIAVFNSGFRELLSPGEQRLHLLAIVLVVMAAAMIMTPAAYHRQTGAMRLTTRFIKISTRLLLWSMCPLAIGISLDAYLIARMILLDAAVAGIIAGLLFTMLMALWYGLPRSRAAQRFLGSPD